jgi:hypothetical protein
MFAMRGVSVFLLLKKVGKGRAGAKGYLATPVGHPQGWFFYEV